MGRQPAGWVISSKEATGGVNGLFVRRQDQRWAATGLCFLLLLWAGASLGQTNSEPKILFLHLKVKNQAVSLVETVTRPGFLKSPRDPGGDGLYFELLSVTGESLWKAAVADPRIRHLEYSQVGFDHF